MDPLFGTQRTWKQMGINDKNASRTYRQLNKKPLELYNEKKVSINA